MTVYYFDKIWTWESGLEGWTAPSTLGGNWTGYSGNPAGCLEVDFTGQTFTGDLFQLSTTWQSLLGPLPSTASVVSIEVVDFQRYIQVISPDDSLVAFWRPPTFYDPVGGHAVDLEIGSTQYTLVESIPRIQTADTGWVTFPDLKTVVIPGQFGSSSFNLNINFFLGTATSTSNVNFLLDNLWLRIGVDMQDPIHTTSSLLKKADIESSHDTDSYLVFQFTQVHTTDSYKISSPEKKHYTDSDLLGSVEKTQDVDSLLVIQSTLDSTSDSLLVGSPISVYTTDATLAGEVAKSSTVDSFLLGVYTPGHTTDAVVLRFYTKSHSTNAYKRWVQTKTHDVDSYIISVVRVTNTTSSFLREPVSKFYTTDADLSGTSRRQHKTSSYLASNARFRIYELLPLFLKMKDMEASGSSGQDPILKKIIDSVEEQVVGTERFAVGLLQLHNVLTTNVEYLPFINRLLGSSYYDGWTDDLKRLFSSEAIPWHKIHSTAFSVNKKLKYRALGAYTITELYKHDQTDERGDYSTVQDGDHPYRAARIIVTRL